MAYEAQQRAIAALRSTRKYIQQAHDKAEAKHDNHGEYYMDDGQYEIMKTADVLLKEIDIIVSDFESV
jgi:hypothetical protein